LEVGKESGLLMGAFLWWTHRGQGCGGIRLQPYSGFEAYIRDGMRLSLGMGRKSALAGLWCVKRPIRLHATHRPGLGLTLVLFHRVGLLLLFLLLLLLLLLLWFTQQVGWW